MKFSQVRLRDRFTCAGQKYIRIRNVYTDQLLHRRLNELEPHKIDDLLRNAVHISGPRDGELTFLPMTKK